MIVAIDGPAGAGKSTVARALAERLGFRYLDTGAMYRASPGSRCSAGLPLGDGAPLGDLARENPITFDEAGRVFIAGTDVTAAIRQVRVDRMVPVVARHPEVREVMRERQRELAAEGNVVIEGRDIGTVVAPDAEVKVYLVADPAVRAQRRQAERPEIGADALATDLKLRDESDQPRMQPAADAEEIDTTELEIDDVVARIEELVRARRPWRSRWPTATSPGRPRGYWIAPLAIALTRGRGYGLERIPPSGGCVLAINHLAWIDIPLVGGLSPRNINYVAKIELRRVPRARAVPRLARDHRHPPRRVRPRRGAGDARVRARPGARSASSSRGRGRSPAGPGHVQPGAAMVAIQEDVPVVPIAVYGTQFWKLGNFAPCSIAVGEPFRFEGVAKGGKGYKEASLEIERRINVLFDWLADVHARGRPRGEVPPL